MRTKQRSRRPGRTADRPAADDAAALGRAITRALRGGEPRRAAGGMNPDRGCRVGITGAPGVGKSTLVAALARRIIDRGGRAAVVASDPASPATGGAFLGDRVRLAGFRLAAEPRVFFRSLSCRTPGGVGEEAARAADVLAAAGYPWVFLETVGAGQGETAVRAIAPTVVVVVSPEAGDEIQWLKAGILEIADILVVNRADRPGAAKARAALQERVRAAARAAGGWTPPVLLTEAVTGGGIDELLDVLDRRRAWLLEAGNREPAEKRER